MSVSIGWRTDRRLFYTSFIWHKCFLLQQVFYFCPIFNISIKITFSFDQYRNMYVISTAYPRNGYCYACEDTTKTTLNNRTFCMHLHRNSISTHCLIQWLLFTKAVIQTAKFTRNNKNNDDDGDNNNNYEKNECGNH